MLNFRQSVVVSVAIIMMLMAGRDSVAEPTATSLNNEIAKAIDQAITGRMQTDDAVGMAIGIIEQGEIVYLKGYGSADREQMIPVTLDTMFRWGSISKPVTAIAAMQLFEQGQLDLDADVRDYVPEFPDHGPKITPRQLLCHQGGIVHYYGRRKQVKKKYTQLNPFENVVTALDRFSPSPLVNQPGEKYSYSTHGYILLSAVVQRAGEQPFHAQVAERICQPLGMKTLQPDYQWINIPHRTIGYRESRSKIIRSIDVDVSWKLGGGGFISTIEDLAQFAQALINGKLVTEQTEALMWTSQKTADGTETEYGLGFVVMQNDGRLKVSHSGAQHKTRTLMVLYPTERQGIVIMTNSEYIKVSQYTALAYATIKSARAVRSSRSAQ